MGVMKCIKFIVRKYRSISRKNCVLDCFQIKAKSKDRCCCCWLFFVAVAAAVVVGDVIIVAEEAGVERESGNHTAKVGIVVVEEVDADVMVKTMKRYPH